MGFSQRVGIKRGNALHNLHSFKPNKKTVLLLKAAPELVQTGQTKKKHMLQPNFPMSKSRLGSLTLLYAQETPPKYLVSPGTNA